MNNVIHRTQEYFLAAIEARKTGSKPPTPPTLPTTLFTDCNLQNTIHLVIDKAESPEDKLGFVQGFIKKHLLLSNFSEELAAEASKGITDSIDVNNIVLDETVIVLFNAEPDAACFGIIHTDVPIQTLNFVLQDSDIDYLFRVPKQ